MWLQVRRRITGWPSAPLLHRPQAKIRSETKEPFPRLVSVRHLSVDKVWLQRRAPYVSGGVSPSERTSGALPSMPP